MNKRILIKTLVFFIIVLLSDQIIGRVLSHLYFNQKAGQAYSLNYSFSECNADILIFGNSRAQHHFDTRILADSLKMSCYNAGQDGGHSILLAYAQIKIITERYSPKIIILEFTPSNIVRYPGDYDRLSILLPYYQDYPGIRPIILLRSHYERVKLLSAIYPFNSKLNTNLMNIIRSRSNIPQVMELDHDGYIPLYGKMTLDMLKPDEKHADTEPVVDNNMVEALNNIISICKEKNISLYVFSSPVYHKIGEERGPVSKIEKISLEIMKNNRTYYFDYSYDSAFVGNLEFFKDQNHLNNYGAKVFSNDVVIKINKQIHHASEKE